MPQLNPDNYPSVAPKLSDVLLGAQAPDWITKTFTVAAIANLISQSNVFTLNTIDSMKELSSEDLENGQVVNVLGYVTVGDGGGGVFTYSSASSAPDNGGTVIAPDMGSGRWLRVMGDGEVNVKWFGATGDGDTDDTEAIQAAIDLAEAMYASNQLPLTVRMPCGTYKVSATLTLNSDGISIMGDGMKSSIFYRDADYGTTLHVTGAYMGGVNIKGLGFLSDPNVTVTSGSHLICQQLAGSVISDLWIQDGFVGITNQGCYDIIFDNIRIWGGQNLSGPNTAGSAYFAVPTNGNPANPSFDCLISNFLFRNSSAGAEKWVADGLRINQCDGIWLSNGHIIGANREMLINVPATYMAQNIQCVNLFLDGQTQVHLQITGAGNAAGIRFGSGCVFGGADGTSSADSVAINCALLRGLFFEGCEWGSNQAAALDLIAGEYITVSNCKFTDNALAGGGNVLVIAAGANRVNILGNSFGYQPANAAIFVNGGTNVVIQGNSFSQAGTSDITLNSVGSNTQIQGNFTDRSNALTAAATLTVNSVQEDYAVSGNTGITALSSGVYGQKARLIFSGTPTVTNSASLRLAGGSNFSATANDVLHLMCLGAGNWTEVSRTVI